MKFEDVQLEELLRLEADAFRAGVFNRTPFAGPCRPKVEKTSQGRVMFRLSRHAVLPIAAALAMVVGLEWMGPGQVSNGPASSGSSKSHQTAMNCNGDVNTQFTLVSFNSCLSGPGESISRECICADLDRDGDVDLIDYGVFQRSAPNLF